MGSFIEAKNLRKTYHVGKIEVEALRDISFSVAKGEFVSVVGPSGSGKSTLFYLLGGLTRADGGSEQYGWRSHSPRLSSPNTGCEYQTNPTVVASAIVASEINSRARSSVRCATRGASAGGIG